MSTIKPFRIEIPNGILDDLNRRLAHSRWSEALPGEAWSRGVPVSYLKALTDYWRDGYNWRTHEVRLNQWPQFTTDIDGQTIHFVHIKSPEPNAIPLILTHGWPGSFVEFQKVIGPLSDPRQHGGDPALAFDVVVPSLPGFGFSMPLVDAGWHVGRIAKAWAELMRRLGYARYGVQGGDFGAIVSPELGRVAPDHVIGVHLNAATVGFFPFEPPPADEMAALSEVERARLQRLAHFRAEQFGYNLVHSTRPQTLAFALADSPIGQLAWIVEKFKEWTDPTAALPEDAVGRDELLTNVMLYWLTNTAGTSANLYYENMHATGWNPFAPSKVPTGVAAFATDIAIRRYGERAHNIVHWTDFDRGGHFAAMETPDLLVDDIRTFFGKLSV